MVEQAEGRKFAKVDDVLLRTDILVAEALKDQTSMNWATLNRGREVIQAEADALKLAANALDGRFVAACDMILHTKNRVVVTGMGKSGHIARKISATLAATGTPSLYLHPAEASHGDLGMMIQGDTLIVISNSGNTAELRPVLHYARALSIPIIGIASQASSIVMDYSDIGLILPSTPEACAANIAPTTSTTMQLAVGDALALAVMDMRGVTSDSLRSLHPGGTIGLRLTSLRDVMHGRDRMPMVGANASMTDAILVITSGSFGIAGVTDDEGRLIGVITDGDLRRHFSHLNSARAADIMTSNPKTLGADLLAQDALLYLNANKISAAFVLDIEGGNFEKPIGIVHLHDFLRFGLE
ncbi:KpsF/GutQ family sugar-phosphate isomerase [Sphingobium sufflavum]|uniref:KpsF/GutQ family sugar-phosphate isomerase n=1 Tax=Sphingobium sufflavum TaxID=1129547 RepID=UPI001F2F0473|nr:KpsF/GutQ family sugar-phosphate isomerase [Sphingobium sufflavum]MCE7798390.1 KpsF/GutQ family sugar-phosphate isomerase [Sphingobium sufflavum]